MIFWGETLIVGKDAEGNPPDSPFAAHIVGGPERVRDALGALLDAGLDHIIVNDVGGARDGTGAGSAAADAGNTGAPWS